MERFRRGYYHWIYLHAAFVLVVTLLGSPLFTVSIAFAAVPLAVWSVVAMGLLFALAYQILGDDVGRRWIHLLSGVRTLGAALVWAVVADAPIVPRGWALVAALAMVELTDLFDGRIARRRGATAFGAVWDMENDAMFTLALAYGATALNGVGPFVLLVGLMRYIYFLAFRIDHDPPDAGTAYKQFARTVAAVTVVGLILTYVPGLALWMRNGIAAVVLTLQLVSFGWDGLLQARAGRIRIGAQLSGRT